MKTIGLLGGMSWKSTADYYRLINQDVRESLGGFHSAKLILHSVDFAPIEKMQNEGDWAGMAKELSSAALGLQGAGADFLLICTNTMHKLADNIEEGVDIPLLHIADATAKALLNKNISTVGLLGTAFTMEQDFYKGRLTDKFGLEVITPNSQDRAIVHNIIYQELCQGEIRPDSKQQYLRIIDWLAAQGAEAIILGCTEIGLLVQQEDTQVKLFDTTAIHAQQAVALALE